MLNKVLNEIIKETETYFKRLGQIQTGWRTYKTETDGTTFYTIRKEPKYLKDDYRKFINLLPKCSVLAFILILLFYSLS